MQQADNLRVGYVVKRYPRFSETFIVNEILAHEEAGAHVEIFSLRPCNDIHFQDIISRVRGCVHYVPPERIRATLLWDVFRTAEAQLPNFSGHMRNCLREDVHEVYQAIQLALTAKQNNIGHLHAHFATTATSVTRLAAKFLGIPYTFTAHAKDIFHEDVNDRRLQAKLADAAAVVTVSDFNVQYLAEKFPAAASRLVRVYNGLDLEKFRFQSPADRPPKIVAVGRLVEKKGFPDLIAACGLLARDGRQFSCDIIGDGDLVPRLNREIAAHDAQQHVRLLGGLPQAEVMRRVQEAAALAAPCVVGRDGNRDGMPTVLLEAMALGTACVSTDVTGIPELITHGETGLLTAQNSPAELAAALARLLDEPATRVQLATAARQRIEAEYDVRRSTATLREIFLAAQQPAQRQGVASEVA